MLDLAEVRSGLMQLDRRLDELARGLESKADTDTGSPVVDRGPVSHGPVTPTVADVPASIPLVSPSQSVSPPASPAVSPPVTIGGAATPDAVPAEPSTASSSPAALNDAATVTLARAEEEAAQILARVHQRADEVKGQIQELLGMRDHLRVTTHEIMVTYAQALNALERQFDGSATDAIDEAEGDAPAPGTVSPPARRFAGEVKVVAGPVRDLGEIRILEDALRGIEAVERISLTGFADRSVQIELHLSVECELVTEFERALPFGFEVESMSDAELVLRLRAA